MSAALSLIEGRGGFGHARKGMLDDIWGKPFVATGRVEFLSCTGCWSPELLLKVSAFAS